MGEKIKRVELWELMSPWRKLWLRIFGKVNTGWTVKRSEWSSGLPLYALKCDKHGIIQDCCPKCLEEKEEK